MRTLPDVRASAASAAAATLAEVRDLSFSYKSGSPAALAGVDLEFRRHEFVCLLGPSGCGKTTLLRLLAGLEHGATGQLNWIGGTPGIGMIFQGRSVFPWLTVEQNVGYGIAPSVPRDERRRRVEMWIEHMGLSRFARRHGYELSGGMAQRVAIARALAADAQLLLCDEPFAAVDEPTRLLLQQDLTRAWQETRPTVVFVTHSIQESLLLADRIVLMSASPGRVRSIVAPPWARPRDPFALPGQDGYVEMSRSMWDQLREEMLIQRSQ